MNWSFALHIIGIIFWTGGLLILSRFARLLTGPNPPGGDFAATLRKSWHLYVVHGVGLTLLTGFYQLFAGGGPGYYFKQGWFHGKVTLVLLLLVATAIMGFEMKNVGESQPVRASRLKAVQILTIISMIGIVFLTKALRP